MKVMWQQFVFSQYSHQRVPSLGLENGSLGFLKSEPLHSYLSHLEHSSRMKFPFHGSVLSEVLDRLSQQSISIQSPTIIRVWMQTMRGCVG